MSSHYYNYSRLGAIDGNVKPENLHLCIETDSGDYLYVVDSADNKIMKKIKTSDRTVETVTTRTKKICRIWHDRPNNTLYCIESNLDNTTSYVFKVDMSDDSITELESVPFDIFDVWMYDSDLWILYFADGYTLETGDIDPNGDVSHDGDWSPVPNDGVFWDKIDSPYETGRYVACSPAGSNEAIVFSMETIALGGYDNGEIYQIQCYIKCAMSGTTADVLNVEGNQAGMSSQQINVPHTTFTWKVVTWSGLNLVQADLDALEITLTTDASIPDWLNVCGMYCKVFFYGNASNNLVYVKNVTDDDANYEDVGSKTGRSWDISMISIVGTDFYFNFHWSNENVKLYKFATGTTTFSMVKEIT